MEIGPLPRLWKSPEGTLPSLALLSLVSADMVMEGAPNVRVKEKGNRRINKPLSLFDFRRHSYACAFCRAFLAFIPPIHYLQLSFLTFITQRSCLSSCNASSSFSLLESLAQLTIQTLQSTRFNYSVSNDKRATRRFYQAILIIKTAIINYKPT